MERSFFLCIEFFAAFAGCTHRPVGSQSSSSSRADRRERDKCPTQIVAGWNRAGEIVVDGFPCGTVYLRDSLGSRSRWHAEEAKAPRGYAEIVHARPCSKAPIASSEWR